MKTKQYEEFQGKFCKVVINTQLGEKSLKGIVTTFNDSILIKGDFQTTSVANSEIVRISKKEGGDIKE